MLAMVLVHLVQLHVSPTVTLSCVYEQGHHSKDGIQHLKPAIETLAQQRGLPCTYGKPRPGCMWLDLPQPSLLRSLAAILRRIVSCV